MALSNSWHLFTYIYILFEKEKNSKNKDSGTYWYKAEKRFFFFGFLSLISLDVFIFFKNCCYFRIFLVFGIQTQRPKIF